MSYRNTQEIEYMFKRTCNTKISSQKEPVKSRGKVSLHSQTAEAATSYYNIMQRGFNLKRKKQYQQKPSALGDPKPSSKIHKSDSEQSLLKSLSDQ